MVVMETAKHRDPEQTRSELLEAAFKEVYENGFKAASLERILSNTHLTKGALYHHFPNKQAMGLAVVDEVIGAAIRRNFVEPLECTDDPIQLLMDYVDLPIPGDAEYRMRCGCPLNNLTQEMSAIDDEFRAHLCAIFDEWQGALAGAFRRGQKRGNVRREVDAGQAAVFVIAAYEGAIGLSKAFRSVSLFGQFAAQLKVYLQALRP